MAEQTILIAEDDADIRDGVRILMAGEGYRILEAENGPKALKLILLGSGPGDPGRDDAGHVGAAGL